MPRRTQPSTSRTSPPSARRPATVDVDPRWILKAVAAVILAALVCGYLTLCLLFYVGQWQIVLHPARTAAAHPPIADGSVEFVRFAPDDSAVPQLSGWWIPAAPGGRYSDATLLYLPSGNGSLADASASLAVLHGLGVNIFAVDYRGYGQSSTTHPSQSNMTADAEDAWRYLHTSRRLPEQQIVPYGVGVGASLAAHLAVAHPQTPALILESPYTDLLDVLLLDPRTSLLPARLLFHERFPLAEPLGSLRTPKLLLSGNKASPAFKTAADPKIAVEFNANAGQLSSQPEFLPLLTRFLDQSVPRASVR
ncbi:alpha/beta hydrolase [Granulicella sp. dw_53]|uniref:alpha/beta hydrolase n=1 Tax=Granulicella sp. dw_53 TaxID=2719792 RepID=UPI001BD5273E|nr:alpha/beta hydrolase [Granulicella sp. dw_53]